jgi:DNA polymerase-3 subunit beta
MCDEASAADAGSVIRVTIADNNAFFDFAGMVYSIKLVDAKFPPYSQVIPKGNDSIAEVDRLALIEACKAISVASNERTGGVKFRFSKGTLRIEAESPEHGDGADELIIGYTGPNISVGFNAKYIVDACNVLSCEEVVLKLNGELDPLMVAPEAESGDDFLCVVMPMRI